ncbi:MAG: lipid-A-disaccharide synthase [Caulobacter sp.]|nr:lipid-A-disaccharide synthase [Caulobacter sp.]
MTRPLTVMLVAAEASGDSLGAGLARALKARLGDAVRFTGVGGAKMAAEGVASPFDIADLSILGIFEAIPAYPRIRKRVAETGALAAAEQPDVAVLIDSWGFTLRVAHAIRKASPKTLLVKYVGPQVWATRPGRAKTLAKAVDHLLTIHGFDAPWFEKEGLPTTFVGNPALAKDFGKADPERLRAHVGAAPDDEILLVLPGSRPAEIRLVMPVFAEAVSLIMDERPNVHVVIPVAATVSRLIKDQVGDWPYRVSLIEDEQLKDDAFVAGTVALACSGTVTTELALAGVPVVVAYKLGGLTHSILKLLFKSPWITMFNIAAKDFVAPEYVQDQCTPENLAGAVNERLNDPILRARQIAAQNAALAAMGRGGPDPAEIAADTILKLLAERES